MKNLLFIMFMFVNAVSYSQDIFPLDNAKWTGFHLHGFPDTPTYCYFSYIIQGDTVVDNITRSKLYYIPDISRTDTLLIGYFHVIDSIVYYRMHSFYDEDSQAVECLCEEYASDYPLYDFSLKKGDRYYQCGSAYRFYEVTSIEYVEFGGKLRKKINFHDDYWIEGMGSYQGFFEGKHRLPNVDGSFVSCGDAWIDYVCFSVNDEVLYMNPSYSDCPIPKFGQEFYRPCLDGERIRWSILGNKLWNGFSSYDLMAYGDTIINDISYKKLYYYSTRIEFEKPNEWKDRIDGYDEYGFLIRESDDASKLYVYDPFRQKEYLVSDMNLEIGDKFTIPEIWKNYYSPFSNNTLLVDSVYVQDGLKHIRFDHQEPVWWYSFIWYFKPLYLTFIEGIGPNIGMFYECEDDVESALVNCFVNGSFYYKNLFVSYPCGYWEGGGSIDHVFSGKEYSVQVNESHIEIYAVGAGDDPIRAMLFDLSGRICYNRVYPAMETILIPRSSFSRGVYLLKIAGENKSRPQVIKIIL